MVTMGTETAGIGFRDTTRANLLGFSLGFLEIPVSTDITLSANREAAIARILHARVS